MWVVWTECLDLAERGEGTSMLSWGRELLPSLRRPGPGDVSLVTPHHRLIVPIDCGRGPGWVCWILSSSRFYESWSFHFLSWPWRSNKALIESEWRGLNSWLLARLEWERRRASGSFLMTTDALVSGLSQTAWHQLQSFLKSWWSPWIAVVILEMLPRILILDLFPNISPWQGRTLPRKPEIVSRQPGQDPAAGAGGWFTLITRHWHTGAKNSRIMRVPGPLMPR